MITDTIREFRLSENVRSKLVSRNARLLNETAVEDPRVPSDGEGLPKARNDVLKESHHLIAGRKKKSHLDHRQNAENDIIDFRCMQFRQLIRCESSSSCKISCSPSLSSTSSSAAGASGVTSTLRLRGDRLPRMCEAICSGRKATASAMLTNIASWTVALEWKRWKRNPEKYIPPKPPSPQPTLNNPITTPVTSMYLFAHAVSAGCAGAIHSAAAHDSIQKFRRDCSPKKWSSVNTVAALRTSDVTTIWMGIQSL